MTSLSHIQALVPHYESNEVQLANLALSHYDGQFQLENRRNSNVTLVFYKTIAASLIFFTSLAMAIFPLKKKSSLALDSSRGFGDAIASGIFLGAAFFHLLPDAIQLFNQATHSICLRPEIICGFSFLLMLLLEHLTQSYHALHGKNILPLLLSGILMLHALIEGAALGLGATLSETIMLFIAILAHKGSESFALCITLLRHQLPLHRLLMIVFFFSWMTPIGILLGTSVSGLALGSQGSLAAALLEAFAAGTFFYIATLHHLRFQQYRNASHRLTDFISVISAAGIMGIIALWT